MQNFTSNPTHSIAPQFASHEHHWLHDHLKTIAHGAITATVLVTGTIALQLIYPSSLTTPLLRVNGAFVGVKNENALKSQLTSMNNQQITIATAQKTYDQTYDQIGSTINSEATAHDLKKYTLRERLIPFSLFRFSSPSRTNMSYDSAKLQSLADKIQSENTTPAFNAAVVVENGEYKIAKDSINGQTYEPETVVNTLKAAAPGKTKKVDLPTAVVEPAVTSAEAASTIERLKQQTTQKTYLKVDNKEFLIQAKELKKFISISFDKNKNLLAAEYDKKAITKFVTKVAEQVYIPPKQPIVRVHDGETTSTTEGKSGRHLVIPEATKAVIKGLKENQQTIEVKTKAVGLSANFIRSYSNNSKGLSILLQDWQADTGINAGVTVIELNGKKRSASLNGQTTFIQASISKLFLTHYLYYGITNDKWKASSTLGTGRSIDSCLDAMIVVSDNGCFNNLGAAVGWSNLTNFTQSQGFTATNPNPAVYTTNSNDVAWYLQKLHQGTLVTSSQRTELLNNMKRQIYRTGIPLGSGGVVANKVGYHGGYRHDAGIVYHTNSTYVIAIMTQYGNNSQISDLARRVSNFMDK